jgi:hypothetical protein
MRYTPFIFLLAYSPNTPRVGLRLLHVRIDSFRVVRDDGTVHKFNFAEIF